uniref:Ribosomal protein S3 n=1 Tax=Nitzschia alba TaxID=2858 RepID=A0A2R4A3F4_NITAL|nr:ribosomal protein S3 [Nitzschia alba]AVR57597.1 ribosomal protein S3 [Nitzschia alba]
MGQKINPNIFRLGINKTWKTEFFEKKTHELPLYTFKDLEIKSYIERFFETQGIILHDYKQHYSDSTLNLYVSYFISSEFIIDKKLDNNSKVTLIDKEGNKKTVLDTSLDTKQILNLKAPLFKNQNILNSYKIKEYLKANSSLLLKPDSNEIVPVKKFVENSTSLKVEGILNNLFKVLSLFTNNKFNIIINFCCLNKDLNFLKKTQKKNFILLQKFKGTPFLKEGIELLFHVVYNRSSAHLLTKFIAIQIKKVKRHKFFLSFLKQTLTILSNSEFSKVKGIKILIKGRLNGVPRAKHKTITIGDTPVQSFNSTLDYSQMTVHNANGSYGIKVWIIEK